VERRLLQIYKTMNMNLVKKQRNIFLVVQVGSQEVELAVVVGFGSDIDLLG